MKKIFIFVPVRDSAIAASCDEPTTSYQLVCTWYEPAPKIRICSYLCTRATSPPQKITEGLLMKLLQKNKIKNNDLNTEFTEMGVFSAVAGNQLPNQMQKRVLPALFHLRCPSQSHQRSRFFMKHSSNKRKAPNYHCYF